MYGGQYTQNVCRSYPPRICWGPTCRTLFRDITASCARGAELPTVALLCARHFLPVLHARLSRCRDALLSASSALWSSFLLAVTLPISDVCLINNLIPFGVRLMTCCGGSCRRSGCAPHAPAESVVFQAERRAISG
jgi:hypothetical protein